MLNTEKIMQALNGADDEMLEDARRCMGYGTAARSRRARRMGWRVALIAAALAALFAATAYAMDWFGLSSRLTASPTETERQGGYISMNGYAGTPEGQAHAEWAQFWTDYVKNKTFSNDPDLEWLAGDQELERYQNIYAAWDQTMLDKLLEIRDKYKVKLHAQSTVVPDAEYFYKVTGLAPFIQGEHEIWPKIIYEEGSFSLEGSIDGRFFSLDRGAKGYLDPAHNYINNSEEYIEWQYTTSAGALLNLAARNTDDGQSVFVFYQDENYLVTIMAGVSGGEDYKTKAEAFAEKFDYAALCTGTIDLSVVVDTRPTQAKPKNGLLTLKDWVETDEYQASTEFQRFFAELVGEWPEHDGIVEGFMEYYYYGSFPSQYEEVNEEYNRITETYGLKMPEQSIVIWGRKQIPYENMNILNGVILPEGKTLNDFPSLEVAEIYKQMGVEPFIADGEPGDAVIYDNGVFFCPMTDGGDLHYIPKGSFSPLVRFCLHPDGEGWAYNTACGEQVYIVQGGDMEYPVWDYSSIIYETDTAYVIILNNTGRDEPYLLEDIADNVDFTKFK